MIIPLVTEAPLRLEPVTRDAFADVTPVATVPPQRSAPSAHRH